MRGFAFGVRSVRETTAVPASGLYHNLVWEGRFPRLVCGITGARAGGDFSLSSARSRSDLIAAYRRLAGQLGFGAVALASQVHGSRVATVSSSSRARRAARGRSDAEGAAPTPTLRVVGEADGLLCEDPGTLLAVSVADCVPVYLLAVGKRAVLLLHAGWRGVAAGILEAGVSRLSAHTDSPAGGLWAHFGPAICGRCYEVGPEVLTALGHPAGRGHVDLRRELTTRILAAGVPRAQVSVSPWCSRCSGDRFHSHRGSQGGTGRMAAFLGWRGKAPPSFARQGSPG